MTTVAGFRYMQGTDPGAVGAGFEWVNTNTGDWSIRNAANTGWTLIGNVNSTNVGLVPATGTTMTGPLSGATGLAPTTAPDFASSAKRDGYELARMTDLAALRLELLTTVTNKVNGVIANANQSTVVNNIAFAVTAWTKNYNENVFIALPNYPDETPAVASQIRGYGVIPLCWNHPDHAAGAGSNNIVQIDETGVGTRTFNIQVWNDLGVTINGIKGISFILCTR